MVYTTLFFDLDETLYASGNGLWDAISARMNHYMIERLGLPVERVPEMRRNYYLTYGTTLRGLQKDYDVDADDYLAYVHDLPLDRYLKPWPELRRMLLSLPQQRWVFTNADADHAERVLSILGVKDCFEGIIDVRAILFACKPEPVAYQRALALAGNPIPHQCVMLDDSVKNLSAACQMGFTTVLVHTNGLKEDIPPGVSLHLPDLLDLPLALPELYEV